MRVLVACENSGIVRRAFRDRGHDAWSCDLLESEDDSPFHYQCNVVELLAATKGHWKILVGHPTCTFLNNAGVRHLHHTPPNPDPDKVYGEARWDAMRKGAAFFRFLLNQDIEHIAIENPIPHGYAVAEIGRKYDQIIQPWQFGHGETKATCLWLKNLPLLQPTDVVSGRDNRVHRMPPGPDRWRERSRTFIGIAKAMADQWGSETMTREDVAA